MNEWKFTQKNWFKGIMELSRGVVKDEWNEDWCAKKEMKEGTKRIK